MLYVEENNKCRVQVATHKALCMQHTMMTYKEVKVKLHALLSLTLQGVGHLPSKERCIPPQTHQTDDYVGHTGNLNM